MVSIYSIVAILNMSKTTEISVVIPVKNEAGNIDTLVSEIHQSLKRFSYEIIYVNDGSEDNTELELKNNMKNNKKLRVISHENSQGQSAALRTGIKASNSKLIATLDGDGQNDPSDLPKMIDTCLLYTSPSPRDGLLSRMPSSA